MSFSLYLGPYQPFLEEELASAVATFRCADPFSPLVILVPNRSLVRHLREDLTRRNGSTFNLRVLTLHQYLIEFTEEKWIAEGYRLLPESLVPWVLRENARRVRPKGGPFVAVSATPGFHKTLRATLSELRQGGFTAKELGDSAKAIAKDRTRKRLSEKLTEFSALLTENGAWKKKNGWKDREDLYEDALTLPPPEALVWTYGFYDASALQQKVLQHLCSGQGSHWFIPYEEDHPAFEYAKPFVDWSKSHGGKVKVGKFESKKGTALGRLQNELFKDQDTPHPGFARPLPQGERETNSPSPSTGEGRDEGGFDASDVKILLCPGETREMREVTRTLVEEAKRRKTHLSQCGLILRQFETYRRMIAPAFEGQKVPLSKKPPVFLMETPEAKAFLLLLECFQLEFPRETLMDLLSCPNLAPDGFGVDEEDWNPHLWDLASKEAGVVEGEGAWMDRMKEQVQTPSGKGAWEEEEASSDETRSLSAFRTQVLQTLFDARHRFEKEKDWVGKTGVLFDLAEKVFIASKAKEELKTLRRGMGILSKGSFAVEKDELEALLSGLMDEVRIPWEAPQEGGVEVSDLMQARGVPFDVLVLPGLVEQGFPRVPRPDPLLLDEERRILNERFQGQARVPEKSEGRLEEKLLFILAVRSAKEALLLTACHLHPGSGAPRVPSSYLHEALRAVTGTRQTQWEGDSPFLKKVSVSDWVREEGQSCVDDLEEVLSRFQEARKGNPLPAQAYVEGKPFFNEARQLLKERQGSRKFTTYDGVFQDVEAIKALVQDHSLKDKTLSASRLETYAACPLRYFYRYVLGLKVHPEPERVFQLDPAEKGNLMHSILEETLSRGKKEGWLKERHLGSTSFRGTPRTAARGSGPEGAGADVGISVQRSEIATAQNAPIGAGPRNDTYEGPAFQSGLLPQKALEVLEEETQKAFKKLEKEGLPGSPALWQWSQFSVRKDLKRALEKVLKDEEWTPVDFEKAFGREGQPEVMFQTPAGSFRLEGFMDRVDLSPDGKSLRVVDYKSGSKEGFKKDSVKEGTKIQMPLYLWACRTLYPGVEPTQAVYEFLTAKGDYGSIAFNASDPKTVEEPLKALLTTAAEAVDQGLFPAVAKACDRCDYRTLCGPGAEKRGERKRDDQRIASYYELEALE